MCRIIHYRYAARPWPCTQRPTLPRHRAHIIRWRHFSFVEVLGSVTGAFMGISFGRNNVVERRAGAGWSVGWCAWTGLGCLLSARFGDARRCTTAARAGQVTRVREGAPANQFMYHHHFRHNVLILQRLETSPGGYVTFVRVCTAAWCLLVRDRCGVCWYGVGWDGAGGVWG